MTVTSQPTAKFFTGDDPDPKWPGLEVRGTWDQMGSDKNNGNYRVFSRRDGGGVEGTYTTANGKLTPESPR